MDGHIEVFSGASSGKSTCTVIPSIRACKGPVFAIDIKGELSRLTVGYRQNNKIFDIEDPSAYGYDLFYFLDQAKNLDLAITKIIF